MKIKNIEWPMYFDEIVNIDDDYIDIFVELDDGFTYTMEVATCKWYYTYMDTYETNYLPYSPPKIIVKNLTKENIANALEEYIQDDGYWLKVYLLSVEREHAFDIEIINKLVNEFENTPMKLQSKGIFIENIVYPHLSINNDSKIDIDVILNDSIVYKISAVTPNYYLTYMQEKNVTHMPVGTYDLVLKDITKENIKNVLENYLHYDAFWLKFAHLIKNHGNVFSCELLNSRINELKLNLEDE